MQAGRKTGFRDAALASGLLTQGQLVEAEELLRSAAGADIYAVEPTDAELAAKLVELGHLNSWQSDQLLAGRTRFTLGPYRILDSIGQGGMGQVFKAEHTIMHRLVAIKVLPASKSSPEMVDRFMREIRAQARLDHDNLVRALDAGHDGKVHFLVTEFVPGLDLRRLVRRHGKLGMAQAASIIAQAANGLAHAHAKGLIHRDVKPGNVLVMPDGRVKLSDLGLVGFFDEEHQSELDGRKVVGTADYLSPEQITSPNILTPASDIYALGCTLYYAVTGKVPFPGGTTKYKADAHLRLQPLDPRRLNRELSDAFVDVIADMMAKDPAARIETAEEVVRRLGPWITHGVRAQEPSPWHAGPLLVPPPLPSGSTPHSMTPGFPLLFDSGSTSRDSLTSALQGTSPISAASEDTVPDLISEPAYIETLRQAVRSKWAIILTAVGVAAAVGILTWLVWSMTR